jgi:inner membrane protein
MDSITHIALGACLGEAFAGKTVGKKAMLWGVLAQSIPDIDFLATFWLKTTENLLAHRGFSHSILFALILTPLLALLAEKLHRPHNISLKKWMWFFGLSILLHLVLDTFNNYGVGLLEPFNHTRFSINAVYVADPLFSIGPGIALAALLTTSSRHKLRQFWWRFGMGMSLLYLGYSCANKFMINREVNRLFEKQGIPHDKYFTTPAPFQNILWFVVAGNDSGYHVGYRSLFDNKQKPMQFTFHPRNEYLLKSFADQDDIERLKLFSQDFYTVEKVNDTLIFNDLRFGQVVGWSDPNEKFAFHYFLDYPDQNKLVVQRGRFDKWNSATTSAFIRKIMGH